MATLSGFSGDSDPPRSARAEEIPLTVAISTVANRVGIIAERNLPPGAQWKYLLLWQADDDPEINARAIAHMQDLRAKRMDIDFRPCDGRGAARSRNLAIRVADSEILLFSDDDVVLVREGLQELISAFRRLSDVAMMSCITLTAGGEPAKRYPKRAGKMTLFNCARVGTVELAVRPGEIRRAGIGFDERFGAGSESFLGDEYIFIADCLRMGLDGFFVPIPVAVHSGPSSGGEWWTDRSAVARARVFERVFGGFGALPVKLVFIWRHRRKFPDFCETLRFSRIFLGRHHRG